MYSPLCDLLNIQYPIMQGAFQWLATPDLAAAVSNAGGLGTISASLYKTKDELLDAIARTKALTDKTFCVNISMFPEVVEGEATWDFIHACCEAKVPVVELSGREPKEFVPVLHEAGIKVIHKSTAVRFAKKAAAAGVDVVSVVGFECGGAPGNDDVTSMVLIPAVVDEVDIPVIGGGGVCDGRGLAAMRALGAQGVVLGTRFMATQECGIHPNFKEKMLESNELSTIVVQRSIHFPHRNLKNETTLQVAELEKEENPTIEKIFPYVSGKRQKACYDSGDTEGGVFPCGEVVGRIHDIPTVQEVIARVMAEADAVLSALK
ncbi:MAG: nitronate monooxygenase [Evtepia sp.]|uniref:NAD(P)H-dependent flavin oxidoreductase n=1 Tax=Evtepia sp. TaxID=2773933 RepID=UPI002A74895F|nr:nitronate monooxygenase [Evtepia sp.]MDY3014254.1 nitronate monooxygenase [Evtepia sp.]